MTERLKEMGAKYPYYATYTLTPTVTFTRPEEVKIILKNIDGIPKRTEDLRRMTHHIRQISGPQNLSMLNNPEWHQHRSLLNKAFISNSVFFQPMSKKIDLNISKWGNQPDQVYVGNDLQKMTLDILATCIFGIDFDTLNGKSAEPLAAYNYAIERAFNPIRLIFSFINKIPTASNIKLKQSMDVFDKYIWQIMDQTKQKLATKSGDENTSSLIELMYENGIAEDVIRDNVSIFFVAGHETTATSLTWVLSLLVTHPDVLAKARQEVLTKVPNDLTYDVLKDLIYLDGLIREALRLHPPAPIMGGRITKQEITVGNVRIPPGTNVQMDLVSMAYNPNIWGDPLEVRPERWYQENLTKEQRSAWLPFSGGPRICIGMNFSLIEQKIFLVYLLKTFKEIKLAKEKSN